jgi:hypothetical protein
MENWISVVTNPLGLAAFFVAVLYLLLSKTKLASHVTWAPHAFVGIAIVGAVGGLVLAFLHQTRVTAPISFPIFINGSVMNAQGNKLKGVRIQLFDVGSGKQVGNTEITDRNGSFTLQIQSSDLENKLLRVSAQKDNLEPTETVQLGHNQFRLSIMLSGQQE